MDRREIITSNLPPHDNSAFRMRQELVGCILDSTQLDTLSFKKKSESKGFNKWERTWNDNKEKIVLVTDSHGTICNIELFEKLDIQIDDYLGAPGLHGWYRIENCSKKMENKIVLDLQSIVDPSEKDVDRMIPRCINLYKPDADQIFSRSEQEYYLCAFAVEESKSQPALARLSASVLFRSLPILVSNDAVFDLPFLCGRLGLISECAYSIAYLLEKQFELSATCWCNIGAVLTDNVKSPKDGLLCFCKAIDLDPNLSQPRQGIWHAGRRLMHDYFKNGDYLEALEFAKDVISIGDKYQAPHGFFSYVGLAQEMVGEDKAALGSFKRALSIYPDCEISQAGKKRIQKKEGNQGALTAIRRLIDNGSSDSFVGEERYPWN